MMESSRWGGANVSWVSSSWQVHGIRSELPRTTRMLQTAGITQGAAYHSWALAVANIAGSASSLHPPSNMLMPSMVFLEAWECTMSISTTRPRLRGAQEGADGLSQAAQGVQQVSNVHHACPCCIALPALHQAEHASNNTPQQAETAPRPGPHRWASSIMDLSSSGVPQREDTPKKLVTW